MQLVNHNIKQTGTAEVKNVNIDTEKSSQFSIDPNEVKKDLVYVVEENKVKPIWRVEYKDRAFFYDSATGSEYKLRMK